MTLTVTVSGGQTYTVASGEIDTCDDLRDSVSPRLWSQS